jgi:preprotein translocase subunit SecD
VESLVTKTGRFEIVERLCTQSPCEGEGAYEDVPTGITNEDVAIARPESSPMTGEPIVVVRLREEASPALAELTGRLFETRAGESPDQLTIVLDGEVLVSAPVASPIESGTLQIVGDFTEAEAEVIAGLVASRPMPAEFALTASD